MSEIQTSIFDKDTFAIQVKRSNLRRKAMIFPMQKAHQMIEKLTVETQACPHPDQKNANNKQKYAA